MAHVFDGAHDALNRMRRAYRRGTGCYLTADMIASLAITFIAETWEEEDPRKSPPLKLRGMRDG